MTKWLTLYPDHLRLKLISQWQFNSKLMSWTSFSLPVCTLKQTISSCFLTLFLMIFHSTYSYGASAMCQTLSRSGTVVRVKLSWSFYSSLVQGRVSPLRTANAWKTIWGVSSVAKKIKQHNSPFAKGTTACTLMGFENELHQMAFHCSVFSGWTPWRHVFTFACFLWCHLNSLSGCIGSNI